MSRHGIRHVPSRRAARRGHRLRARPVCAAAPVAQARERHPGAPRRSRAAYSRPRRHPRIRTPPARPGCARAPAHRADQPPQRPAGRTPGARWWRSARPGPAAGLLAGLRLRRPGEQTMATDQDNGLVFASDTPDATARAGWRSAAGRQRGAGRLRLPAVQGQRDGQQPRLLPDRRPSGCSASRTGSNTARPKTCSTPASTSTCGRWPAAT
jgi:hypothetical protein